MQYKIIIPHYTSSIKSTVPRTARGKPRNNFRQKAHLGEMICVEGGVWICYIDSNNFHQDKKNKKWSSWTTDVEDWMSHTPAVPLLLVSFKAPQYVYLELAPTSSKTAASVTTQGKGMILQWACCLQRKKCWKQVVGFVCLFLLIYSLCTFILQIRTYSSTRCWGNFCISRIQCADTTW